MHKRTFFSLFCSFLVLAGILFYFSAVFARTSTATERITSFDSFIEVESSGKITVIETITVTARGDKIKRGIYRDFPTDYTTPAGVRLKVGFTVLDVQRNGQIEPYHTKHLNNGVRVYIGKSNVFLKPGTYTYTIVYQTDRQVGFFDTYDELYWNVTGDGWEFPIDAASATLNLPKQAIIKQHQTYTGKHGSTVSNAEAKIISGSEMTFRTTKPLGIREGFTIAAAWQKGVIKQPEWQDEVSYFMHNNGYLVLSAAGLIILLGYYVIVWFMVGKDPAPQAIIPRFDPPKGFTPAAARFIMRMGFDNKSFASALVNMAVKQYLTIDNDEGTFRLKKTSSARESFLSRGEKKIARKIFAGKDSLTLKRVNHAKISSAIKAMKKSLQTDFEELHFRRNSRYMVPGLLVTILIIVLLFLAYRNSPAALFMSVWLSGWTVGCYFLLVRVFFLWKNAVAGVGGIGDKIGALFLTLFSLPFLGAWCFGFWMFVSETSLVAVFALASVLGANVLFYHLLKAPTIEGRKVMDELEGLKMFLSVAEKDRLNLLNPPEKTPELFERLLPWALALDVEQQWSEQFNDVLVQAAQEGTYSPAWYTGHHDFSPVSLASSLGTSLAGSISSSSTTPGSSSGSGGGGSSGGGGGGGGGGGW